MHVVPFRPEHLSALRLQAAQASAQPLMTVEHGRQIGEQIGEAWTGMVDGRPIACAGMIELWEGRAYAWAYLTDIRGHAKAVHRAVLEALARGRWRRVEMAVDPLHAAAKRWAAHLGFEREGVALAWTPDGRDVEIWARISPRTEAWHH